MRGRHRRAKRILFYAAVRVCFALANALPRGAALTVFGAIGGLVRRVDRPAVGRARAHLALAKGGSLDEAARESVVRGMFRDLARNLVDLLRLPRRTPAEVRALVAFEGEEHLARALARGKGVLAVSAHLGNWELLGAALAGRGVRVHVLAQRLFDARSDRLLAAWRRGAGLVVHSREGGLLSAARALRAGELVGALVDQDTAGPAVEVDFFGQPARTPTSLFLLARRLGAEIVPLTIRLEGAEHRARIHPAIPRSVLADEAARTRQDLLAWHSILERAIDESPTQWVWFHRRWKSSPSPAAARAARAAAPAPRESGLLPSSRRVAISR